MWGNRENEMPRERSQTQGHVYDPIYMNYPEQASPQAQKEAGGQGLGVGSDCSRACLLFVC